MGEESLWLGLGAASAYCWHRCAVSFGLRGASDEACTDRRVSLTPQLLKGLHILLLNYFGHY